MPTHIMPQRNIAPLSPEDASFGRLRLIVALAIAGLIAVGAAYELGVSKSSAADRQAAPPAASVQ